MAASPPLDVSRANAVEPRPGGPRRWVHLPRSGRRRIAFVAVYLAFCWFLALTGIKLFWMMHSSVPFDQRAYTWDFYYPMLRTTGVKDARPRHRDDSFDVLLLGGSVLDPHWGYVEEYLTNRLRENGNRFRVFNLACPGHTSRDSLLKYRQLADDQFELVLVYDGINDVRMNCCPKEVFRDDYTHCSWYYEIQKHIDDGTMSLPARLGDGAALLRPSIYLNSVDARMAEFGREIKTDRTVRRNIEEIVTAAAVRGDTVLLLTFACDLPADYTDERFGNGEFQYALPQNELRCGAGNWGRPEHIIATVKAQNAAIRALARAHPEIPFVDEAALMPNQTRLFVDPCHLSDEGSRRFVENLWPVVAKRLSAWQATHGDK